MLFRSTASGSAVAQQAVPLTEDLFDLAWVIVDYEGRLDVPVVKPATFSLFDRDTGIVGGDTPCGHDWSAKVEFKLPALTISDVQAFYSDDCAASKTVIALIEALERVTSAQTGLEGLELLGEDGGRLLLLVAGG